MSIPRLFLETDLQEGATVPGLPGQGRYLGSVLRRAVGDPVVLFNGRDGEFAATIAALGRDDARFAVGPRRRAQKDAAPVALLLALLKRDAMEWAVEKATEMGVAAIHPVRTARCVADRVNLDRLRLIAREAAEQCERLDLPALHEAMALPRLLDRWPGTRLFVAAERRDVPHLADLAPMPPAALLVGPEGGLAGAELDDLARRPFVAPASLGPRILRAETAVVAGLAWLGAAADRA